ncbi:hypothetical protein [Homoserinimonas hongtaonis]|uniref:Hemagglutinin n=1 Tax=Homoserinimonas hongtaonis TaxID=2079791 RepID=A0A2U1SWX8_9MICO|nr:hypothetical protein [Salinibacterium hongtaonis]PWB96053.1 hypothetical protein DF220_11715 [Salinibacterium hongtaonis]
MKSMRLASIALAATLLATGLTVTEGAEPAVAANAAQFDPGNIISDAYFFDGSAMTASQVQSFLNSKVSACASGYTCLKNYTMATRSIAAVPGRCGAYNSEGVESAAMIIAKVGAACNISQKVLLVTLQKEQSLITSTSPSADRYRIAMGYGCPDTAPCNSEYFGFQNQVYRAALQFQVYLNNPTLFAHGPYRYNNVRLNPTASCGSTSVYIQNSATAALYNYTPYQPNAAALANLYGTGDGCSSYGNRNFWRDYTDWFGSTTVSSLVKTATSNTVYVIGIDGKYSLPSADFLAIFAALGPISQVTQSYLDAFPTIGNANRNLRAPDGTIYFTDASIKLAFNSCAQVSDFGGSCASGGFMQLTDGQIAAFHTGPAMSNVLATVDGFRFFVTGGQKREVVDRASLVAAAIPISEVVLTSNAVSHLAFGEPIARESIFVRNRASGEVSFLGGGTRSPISSSDAVTFGADSRNVGWLTPQSLAKIPASSTPFSGIVSNGGTTSILTESGRREIRAGSPLGGVAATAVSAEFLAQYSPQAPLTAGTFVKTATSGTIYVVMPGDIRPIASWDALLALSAAGEPLYSTVGSAIVEAAPKGPVALTSGSLYRTEGSATVFLINGVTSRIAFSKFDYTTAAGFTKFEFTTPERLNAYPLDNTLLTYGLDCSGTKYITADGTARKVQASELALYPFTFVSLDSFTCAKLTLGSDATDLIRLPDGSIYKLIAGEKRPITSMQRLDEVSNGRSWVQVDSQFGALIPTGAVA